MKLKKNEIFKTIILLPMVVFLTLGCGKKKSSGMFWLLLAAGGGGSSSTAEPVDANGVPLPTNLGTNPPSGTIPQSIAIQEVPTSGEGLIQGNFSATINNLPPGDVCGQSGAPVPPNCLSYSNITVQLVASNGTVIATKNLNEDGSFQFSENNLPNNNYRVLIESGSGLNASYQDFSFVYNPTSLNGVTVVDLGSIPAERLFYTSGLAQLTGNIFTSGFTGDVTVTPGSLSNVPVNLLNSEGAVIASATSNETGNYSFNIPNLPNGYYTVVIDGSAINQHGQSFSIIEQSIHFVFEGTNPGIATEISIPNTNLVWQSATSSSATVTGSIFNAAIANDSTTVYSISLTNSIGQLIASITRTGSGSFSLPGSVMGAGVYSIQIVGKSGDTTITYPSTSSFLFTPHSSGGNKLVSIPSIWIAPKQSNITGRVTDGVLAYVPGSVINFRPANTQLPSNLLYLLQDDRISSLVKLWLVEAGLGACASANFSSACVASNQGVGPWNYQTYSNKVYEVRPDQSVFFTAVAGIWAYYVSAPGYANYCGGNSNCSSNPMTLVLNGQDYNAGNISLTTTLSRSQIAGSILVRDQIQVAASATNHSLNGLFVILLGNTDNSGNPVAHITVSSEGAYSFNASSKVVSLPAGLPNDQARAGIAINAFVGVAIIPGLPVLTATPLSSASTIVGNATSSIHEVSSAYNFRQSSYQILVVDPLGHIGSASFGADTSQVATNNYLSVPVSFNLNSVVNHLPRRQITGSIFNAISTASIASGTIELGRLNSSNQFVADIRRDCSSGNAVSSLTCAISSGSRLTQPKVDQLVSGITVDSNGNFQINNINPGSYVLKISGTGFQDQLVSVTVPSTGIATVVNVGLVPNIGTGNLTGSVKLPGGHSFTGSYNLEIVHPSSGNRPLAGVQPSSLVNGFSSFTNAPLYNVFNLSAGQWKIRFVSAGYVTVEGLVNIQANATTNFDIITMVPGSQPPASIAGTAINGITNTSSGMSGLTVRIRPGINVTAGAFATGLDGVTILPSATTASDGSFAIGNVPAGNYTLEVKGTNVATAYRTVISAGSDTPTSQNVLVTPILGSNEARIILSWNAEPRDLDSHLEYGSSVTSQVVWNDKSKLSGDLTLDVDVVTGFGPETVTLKGSTWTQPRRGYSVYNWSRECKAKNWLGVCSDYSELNESGAIVRVYRSSGLVRTYVVGNAQQSRWWQLFCFNSDKSIVDVGGAGCSQSSFFNASKN